MYLDINWPENMTQDGTGYVYWRGIQVEHYSHDDLNAAQESADELAARCRHLEALGVPVDGNSAIWCWARYADALPGDPILPLLGLRYYEKPGYGLAVWRNERWEVYDGHHFRGVLDVQEDEWRGWYHVMLKRGWRIMDAGQGKDLGDCYATLDGMRRALNRWALFSAADLTGQPETLAA